MASTIDWNVEKQLFHAWTITQDATEQMDFPELESAIQFCLDNEDILNGNGRDLNNIRIFIPTEKFATSPTFMFYLKYTKAKNAGEKYSVRFDALTEQEKHEFEAETCLFHCDNVFAVLNGEFRVPKPNEFFLRGGFPDRDPSFLDEAPILKLVKGQITS